MSKSEDYEDYSMEVSGITRISANESVIVDFVREIVSPNPNIDNILQQKYSLPPKMSITCSDLIADALRQVWPLLFREADVSPNNTGLRLWDVNQPDTLVFSGYTMKFIRYVVESSIHDNNDVLPLPGRGELTLGDQLVMYLTMRAASSNPVRDRLASKTPMSRSSLVWLGFSDILSKSDLGQKPDSKTTKKAKQLEEKCSPDNMDFSKLTTGNGAVVVQALAASIANRLVLVETAKSAVKDPNQLVILGKAQDAVIGGFMSACDKANRRDLATFIIMAGRQVIAKKLAPIPVVFDTGESLSVRGAARVAAAALLRGIQKWNQWDEQHRAVRFMDDNYRSAQFYLKKFEKIGSGGMDVVNGWTTELSKLPV